MKAAHRMSGQSRVAAADPSHATVSTIIAPRITDPATAPFGCPSFQRLWQPWSAIPRTLTRSRLRPGGARQPGNSGGTIPVLVVLPAVTVSRSRHPDLRRTDGVLSAVCQLWPVARVSWSSRRVWRCWTVPSCAPSPRPQRRLGNWTAALASLTDLRSRRNFPADPPGNRCPLVFPVRVSCP